MPNETANSKIIQKFTQSSLIGGSQVLLIFGLTHPLDLMKTRMQADTQRIGAIVHARLIHSSNGFRGFYKAGIPNFTRAFTKELYRSSLRGFFNKFYLDRLSATNLNRKYPDLRNLLTGITMSTVDTFLCSPLERIKVWLMTNNARRPSFLDYFQQKQSFTTTLKDLFRGVNVTFYRNTISWASFLIIEERIRNLVLSKKDYANLGDISILDQLVIGTLSGLFNSAITLPFDTVKTQYQKKDNPFPLGIGKTVKYIVSQKGLIGMWNGWQFRVPNYVIVAIITSNNIQRIDKIWRDEVRKINRRLLEILVDLMRIFIF
jgi:hypothetical protein